MGDILRAEGICKTYHTGMVDVHALKKCDINIRKGEFTAIIGKSGSGKSTLLRILGSMDRPDEGKVYIDDIDISELNDRQLSKLRREKIGYVYQNYSLIPEYTAYENIALPVILDNQDVDEDEINELLVSLQIEHCRNKFPDQMSGGEQQRTAIARALIMHPAVVYADEPTGNLDAESAENVAAMLSLAAAKYKQTIVMVTHDKQMAEYADRILNIVDGQVRTEELLFN
jgi:putative ABC transport system ATP-binding protein